MNVLICPDKFKGSLTAPEVCEAIARGIRIDCPATHTEPVPLADGGEGTCALLTEWYGGEDVEVEVCGPLFTPVAARYGISGDGKSAFIEMAEASGLTLLNPAERNPLITTTLGTGEMIVDALDRGVANIILGIGGSATNDGGIGMASALGYRFCDADGEVLKPIGENLIHLHHILADTLHPRLKDVHFTALCDVINPLSGPEGAAFVYAPQKGADASAVDILDAGLRNFKRVVKKYLHVSVDFPGAGAAGGLGAGASVFLHASMVKGVKYMVKTTGLVDKIRAADMVVTGEGKIDQQTFSGKVVSEIVQLCREAGKPIVVVCGISELSEAEMYSRGVSKVITLVDERTSPADAMQHATSYIVEKVRLAMKELPSAK